MYSLIVARNFRNGIHLTVDKDGAVVYPGAREVAHMIPYDSILLNPIASDTLYKVARHEKCDQKRYSIAYTADESTFNREIAEDESIYHVVHSGALSSFSPMERLGKITYYCPRGYSRTKVENACSELRSAFLPCSVSFYSDTSFELSAVVMPGTRLKIKRTLEKYLQEACETSAYGINVFNTELPRYVIVKAVKEPFFPGKGAIDSGHMYLGKITLHDLHKFDFIPAKILAQCADCSDTAESLWLMAGSLNLVTHFIEQNYGFLHILQTGELICSCSIYHRAALMESAVILLHDMQAFRQQYKGSETITLKTDKAEVTLKPMKYNVQQGLLVADISANAASYGHIAQAVKQIGTLQVTPEQASTTVKGSFISN